MRQRMAHYVGYLLLRALICVAQMVPLDLCGDLAGLLGWLVGDVLKARRKIIAENLRHAFPEQSEAQRQALARQMWRHLFLFALEVCHTGRKIHEENWKQYVRTAGGDVLVGALLDDRPLILVSAHYGNFELSGYILGLFGYATHAVARPLDNPYLNDWLGKFRGSTGQKILSKRGDYERIVDILADGGVVGFLADQYAGRKGCWVRFFARPASAHKAIALFGLTHQARIIVGGCRRIGGPLKYLFEFEALADPCSGAPEVQGVRELTQWYTTALENMVRRDPSQYWWLHRRWKDNRPAHKQARAAARAA